VAVGLDFAVIGLLHRDDARAAIARCPHQYHHAAIQQACSDVTRFVVFQPIILGSEVGSGEYLGSIGEIQSALLKGLDALGLVEGDLHPN
jgi:hypothetical protein